MSDHDESIANDTARDEDAIAAPGTHATSCKEILGKSKEICETSIRQEETPVEKGHPQTVITRKERKEDDVNRITISTMYDIVDIEGATGTKNEDVATNDALGIHTMEHEKRDNKFK